jgi:CTP synthase (UTP-ammonia lyase)
MRWPLVGRHLGLRWDLHFAVARAVCHERQKRVGNATIDGLRVFQLDARQFLYDSGAMKTSRIGIIGDFNPDNLTHNFTNDAIQHAAKALGKPIEAVWLPTNQPAEYAGFQGLFGSPGSPYRSFDGALSGIRYARENKVPLLGTCGGSQHMMIEYARNVMGMADAAPAETDPHASCLFVTPLSCSLVGKTMEVTIRSGSRAAAAFQAERSMEAYYCNFGLNPDYQEQLEDAGLAISGTDVDREARIVELASHPFFIGTLFVPQARSKPSSPHPLILAFCRAAASQE